MNQLGLSTHTAPVALTVYPVAQQLQNSPPHTYWISFEQIKNLSSILLSHPDEVLSWSWKFGYTLADLQDVVQFFVQLCQNHPSKDQQIIKDILAKRSVRVILGRHWQSLHEEDPLRLFDEDRSITGQLLRRRGVPPRGYVHGPQYGPYQASPQDTAYTQGRRGYQLPGYLPTWANLPIGTTLTDIVTLYPNHCKYEFLDGFLQHGINAGNLFSLIPDTIVGDLVQHQVIRQTSGSNVFLKRLSTRRNLLRDALGFNERGINKLEAYFKSNVKIFALGPGAGGNTFNINRAKYSKMDDLRQELARRTAVSQAVPAPSAPGQLYQPQIAHQNMVPVAVQQVHQQMPPQPAVQSTAPVTSTSQNQHIAQDYHITIAPLYQAPAQPAAPVDLMNNIRARIKDDLGILFNQSFWESLDKYHKYCKFMQNHHCTQLKYIEWIVEYLSKTSNAEAELKETERANIIKNLLAAVHDYTYGEEDTDVPAFTDLEKQSEFQEICDRLSALVAYRMRGWSRSTDHPETLKAAKDAQQRAVGRARDATKIVTNYLARWVSAIIEGTPDANRLGNCSFQDLKEADFLINKPHVIYGSATGFNHKVCEMLEYHDPVLKALTQNIIGTVDEMKCNGDQIAWLKKLYDSVVYRQSALKAWRANEVKRIGAGLYDKAWQSYGKLGKYIKSVLVQIDVDKDQDSGMVGMSVIFQDAEVGKVSTTPDHKQPRPNSVQNDAGIFRDETANNTITIMAAQETGHSPKALKPRSNSSLNRGSPRNTTTKKRKVDHFGNEEDSNETGVALQSQQRHTRRVKLTSGTTTTISNAVSNGARINIEQGRSNRVCSKTGLSTHRCSNIDASQIDPAVFLPNLDMAQVPNTGTEQVLLNPNVTPSPSAGHEQMGVSGCQFANTMVDDTGDFDQADGQENDAPVDYESLEVDWMLRDLEGENQDLNGGFGGGFDESFEGV